MELKAVFAQLYSIARAADMTDGSVSFTLGDGYSTVTKAAAGDTVTIVSGADMDYILDTVTVMTDTGTDVPVKNSVFTMPAENVTVTAAFRPLIRTGSGEDGARVYEAGNGDVFLVGGHIELGLRPSGVFGTSAPAPTGTDGDIIFHPKNNNGSAIGLRSNGGRTWSEGLATGTEETVDFFLPGAIDEGWVVGWSESAGGSAVVKGLAQASGGKPTTVTHGGSAAVTTDTNADGKTTLTAVTTAAVADTVDVEQTIRFDADGKYFTTSVTLTNSGEGTLYDLSYIRAFDSDQRSNASSSPNSPSTDNYFYKDSQGNIWVIAFGNNSLNAASAPTAVSFAEMVVNNTAAITPFVFCAKPAGGYTVQAVNTTVGWGSYSGFYRGGSSYKAGADLYGRHYYGDKGIGLEFIVDSLGTGESVTFS